MAAKILLLDIETAPGLGYAWAKYDTNIIKYLRPWYMLSFAWQWLEDKDVTVHALSDYDGYGDDKHNDYALINQLWTALDAADIVVAHNGDSFDIKKSNSRFLVHGLGQPAPFKTVDTLKVVRKHFKFDGNSLTDICAYLGIGGKVPHPGFSLWEGCMAGDPESWGIMKEYNSQDVRLLKEVYLKLRPWCNHPDVSLYGGRTESDIPACPACGSHHSHRRGESVARSRKYQRYQCQDCGKWHNGELVKD